MPGGQTEQVLHDLRWQLDARDAWTQWRLPHTHGEWGLGQRCRGPGGASWASEGTRMPHTPTQTILTNITCFVCYRPCTNMLQKTLYNLLKISCLPYLNTNNYKMSRKIELE